MVAWRRHKKVWLLFSVFVFWNRRKHLAKLFFFFFTDEHILFRAQKEFTYLLNLFKILPTLQTKLLYVSQFFCISYKSMLDLCSQTSPKSFSRIASFTNIAKPPKPSQSQVKQSFCSFFPHVTNFLIIKRFSNCDWKADILSWLSNVRDFWQCF